MLGRSSGRGSFNLPFKNRVCALNCHRGAFALSCLQEAMAFGNDRHTPMWPDDEQLLSDENFVQNQSGANNPFANVPSYLPAGLSTYHAESGRAIGTRTVSGYPGVYAPPHGSAMSAGPPRDPDAGPVYFAAQSYIKSSVSSRTAPSQSSSESGYLTAQYQIYCGYPAPACQNLQHSQLWNCFIASLAQITFLRGSEVSTVDRISVRQNLMFVIYDWPCRFIISRTE